MIKCIKCNSSKTEDNFHFRNKKEGTRRNVCKECSSQYKKEHYKKNKEKYIKKAVERNILIREENRNKIFKYLGDKSCVDCSESNPLTLEFDHKNPNEKRFNVTDKLEMSWKTILEEINKCDIRCSNCHKIRTHKQFNTYRFQYFVSSNLTSDSINN